MAITKIDLNKWEMVGSENDLENYQSLIITPRKFIDGTQPPVLYFRRGAGLKQLIEDTTQVNWSKNCEISNKGTPEEYSERVDWWFDNAIENDEYKTIINDTFNRNGFDVKMSWEKAKMWLKRCVPSKRKTYIHKFVWNWMSGGMTMLLNRLERERSK
jgi:hypothetical protein